MDNIDHNLEKAIADYWDDHKCDNCGGKGQYHVANGPDDYDVEICDHCDGTGWKGGDDDGEDTEIQKS